MPTTEAPTTSTTTTTAEPCTGGCTWQWSEAGQTWLKYGPGNCSTGCSCQAPTEAGTEDGEYQTAACGRLNCCSCNAMYCCGSRPTWPAKLYATFVAPDCSCLDGFSIEMSYVDESPDFKGYVILPYATNSILQPEQFTDCYGVFNSPTYSPPITDCDIGQLAIVMSVICLADSSLEFRVTMTNYAQEIEPTRCIESESYSGYVIGLIDALYPGSFSGSYGSMTLGQFSGTCTYRTFEWDCDGPVIFAFRDNNNPATFSGDSPAVGPGTVSLTDCDAGCFDVLVTE